MVAIMEVSVTVLPKLQQADEALFMRVAHWGSTPHYVQAARLLSRTGDGFYYPLVGLAALLVDWHTGLNFFLACLCAYLLERPLYLLLKNGFKRNRPAVRLSNLVSVVNPSDRFSLPSGHTAAAFVMATMLSAFFPPLATLAYLWAVLVGLSRIVLRVHFPADVGCGAILGVGVAQVVLSHF